MPLSDMSTINLSLDLSQATVPTSLCQGPPRCDKRMFFFFFFFFFNVEVAGYGQGHGSDKSLSIFSSASPSLRFSAAMVRARGVVSSTISREVGAARCGPELRKNTEMSHTDASGMKRAGSRIIPGHLQLEGMAYSGGAEGRNLLALDHSRGNSVLD